MVTNLEGSVQDPKPEAWHIFGLGAKRGSVWTSNYRSGEIPGHASGRVIPPFKSEKTFASKVFFFFFHMHHVDLFQDLSFRSLT